MASLKLNLADRLDAGAVALFRERGFLIIENLLPTKKVDTLRASFPKLFAGRFDTGVYPDEWYWREGISLPDVTRHISNAWKSDLTIAGLALSEDLGRAAALLAGWSGARLGQDTIWWKPPGAKPVALHQDSSFMSFLDPPATVTCWFTLDDTHRDAGTIEYIPASHQWPLSEMPEDFHATEDYRGQMRAAARAAGVAAIDPTFIEVPAGSCVIHAGEIWHGSGPNVTGDRMRRSIGVHLLPECARFSGRQGGYVYRRYQRTGSTELDDSFFPLLWSAGRQRTSWLEEYCRTGVRR